MTMTAALHRRFGDESTAIDVADVPVPSPGPGQVLVKVAAAGIAIGDWLTMTGLPLIARPAYGIVSPKRPILGNEFAGAVVKHGPDTENAPAVGTRVFGYAPQTLAGYAVVNVEHLAATPAHLTDMQAAAAPVSMLTAYQALVTVAKVEKGQRVLILGASGAVGTYSVQVAKARGLHVTAVASARNHEMLVELGADAVVDYRTTEINELGETWDVIVDLAGNRKVSDMRRVLTPSGTAVIVGGSGGKVTMGFGRTVGAMVLNMFVKQTLTNLVSGPNADDIEAIHQLLDSGAVRPVIDRTFPLADVRQAMAHIGSRRTQGKSVVVIDA